MLNDESIPLVISMITIARSGLEEQNANSMQTLPGSPGFPSLQLMITPPNLWYTYK